MPTLTKHKPEPARTPAANGPRTISFRFKRNVMVYDLAPFMPRGEIATPQPFSVVHETANLYDPTSRTGRRELTRVTTEFDLDAVHTIMLEETTPREIRRTPEMSEAWYSKLLDKEMSRAIDEAAPRMDKLRRILQRLTTPICEGALAIVEIVDDPSGFMSESPFFSDEEADVRRREQSEKKALEMLTLANAKKPGPAVRG